MPIRRLTVAASLALMLLLLGAASISLAAAMMFREASLTQGGMAFEVNTDTAGNLFISDARASEIWQLHAGTSTYTKYLGLPQPSDARPDRTGNIWWTDWNRTLGRINVRAGTVTTWEIEPSLGGLALDGGGRLWLATYSYQSTRAALYRFDPQTSELCGYKWEGGSNSDYILYAAGRVWLGDQANQRMIRFDPAAAQNQVRWWSLPPGVHVASTHSRNASPHSRSHSPPLPPNPLYQNSEQSRLPEGLSPRGLALDAAGHLWWADPGAIALASLDPANDQVTIYRLPDGGDPVMLTLDGGRVWYTTLSGSVGALAPALASGTVVTATTGSLSAFASCRSMGTGSTTTASSARGTLAWGTPAKLAPILDGNGWTIYQLQEGAALYGIARSSDSLWVVDNGRQKLIRLGAKGPDRVLLPLVLR